MRARWVGIRPASGEQLSQAGRLPVFMVALSHLSKRQMLGLWATPRVMHCSGTLVLLLWEVGTEVRHMPWRMACLWSVGFNLDGADMRHPVQCLGVVCISTSVGQDWNKVSKLAELWGRSCQGIKASRAELWHSEKTSAVQNVQASENPQRRF